MAHHAMRKPRQGLKVWADNKSTPCQMSNTAFTTNQFPPYNSQKIWEFHRSITLSSRVKVTLTWSTLRRVWISQDPKLTKKRPLIVSTRMAGLNGRQSSKVASQSTAKYRRKEDLNQTSTTYSASRITPWRDRKVKVRLQPEIVIGSLKNPKSNNLNWSA